MRKVLIALAVFTLGVLSSFAGHSNITQTDVKVMSAVSVSANGVGHTSVFLQGQSTTYNAVLARQGLGISTDISALVQGAGTSPNFSVQVLCSMDGITFVKPYTGGDLGTINDSNPHFFSINCPLSPGGIELQFTELGGNALTASSTLAGQ